MASVAEGVERVWMDCFVCQTLAGVERMLEELRRVVGTPADSALHASVEKMCDFLEWPFRCHLQYPAEVTAGTAGRGGKARLGWLRQRRLEHPSIASFTRRRPRRAARTPTRPEPGTGYAQKWCQSCRLVAGRSRDWCPWRWWHAARLPTVAADWGSGVMRGAA